jgi:diguanylate cyclase (GGDEF)-like protein
MRHNLSRGVSRSSLISALPILVWSLVVSASHAWNSQIISQAMAAIAVNSSAFITAANDQQAPHSTLLGSSPTDQAPSHDIAVAKLQYHNDLTHLAAFLLLSVISTVAMMRIQQLLITINSEKKLRDDIIAQKTQSLKKEIKQHKFARNELQRLATHDQLTGLRNRRHFIETLDKELNRYQRYQSHFSLLMLDIDCFAQINDNYGHDCGDYVLKQFAKTISNTLRQSDIFVRYGGKEFAIITTSSQLDSAVRFAEKLVEQVSDMVISYQAQQLKITVSIGVSSPSQLEQPNSQQLVALADKALHLAKDNGRNTVMSTSELMLH